jgi:hypothetical protein
VRALHQVIVAPGRVFAGSRVPVRRLLEHLDGGGTVEEFLVRHPDLSSDTVLAALALGLEALLAQVPSDPPPSQRSLLPRLDSAGVIVNAEELRADQVVGRRVLCPGCRRLVFKSWPEGWDGHAAGPCRGVTARSPETRKAEFKRRFGSLFRS